MEPQTNVCAEQFSRLKTVAREAGMTLEQLALRADCICEIDALRRGVKPLDFQAVLRIHDICPSISIIWIFTGKFNNE